LPLTSLGAAIISPLLNPSSLTSSTVVGILLTLVTSFPSLLNKAVAKAFTLFVSTFLASLYLSVKLP